MGIYNGKSLKSKNIKTTFEIIKSNDDAPLLSNKGRNLFSNCKSDVREILIDAISQSIDTVDKLKYNLNRIPNSNEGKEEYIKKGMNSLDSRFKERTIEKALKNFENSSECSELMEYYNIKLKESKKRKNKNRID